MKKLIFLIVVIFLNCDLSGQQSALVTQYFNQILSFNPAFAGNHKLAEANLTYRKQWLGIDGAPEHQVFNLSMPLLNRRIGVGVGIDRTKIAINQEITANAYYAYRISMESGVLSLGVQASVKNYSADFNDPQIITTQPREGDPAVPEGRVTKTVPNFGFGAYFKGNSYFFGVSAPRMLRNNIDYGDDASITREVLHAFVTAGYTFELSNDIDLQTMSLLKVVKSSPADFDLSFLFRFVDKFGFGMNYRSRNSVLELKGESLSFIFNTAVSNQLVLGLAYDMTLTDLKDYSSGSLELFTRYSFAKKSSTTQPVLE